MEKLPPKKLPKVSTIVLTVVALWIVGGWLLPWLFAEGSKAGEFGDKFGAVNALFSGLAFAGVLYAILLQHQEIELQKEDLKIAREEMRRSADAQTEAARALGEQIRVSSVASRLTALSSLLQSCNDQITQREDCWTNAGKGNEEAGRRYRTLKAKNLDERRDKLDAELEDLLKSLEERINRE